MTIDATPTIAELAQWPNEEADVTARQQSDIADNGEVGEEALLEALDAIDPTFADEKAAR